MVDVNIDKKKWHPAVVTFKEMDKGLRVSINKNTESIATTSFYVPVMYTHVVFWCILITPIWTRPIIGSSRINYEWDIWGEALPHTQLMFQSNKLIKAIRAIVCVNFKKLGERMFVFTCRSCKFNLVTKIWISIVYFQPGKWFVYSHDNW